MNTIYVPLLQVDGDTVTFSFEMRSGREHNTPDKAMWGFLVTVRAQVVYTFRLNFVFDIHYQIYGLEELNHF